MAFRPPPKAATAFAVVIDKGLSGERIASMRTMAQ
jgi:hypothetical protein